ncbi:class A beta-lactamase-related serine hydrolase [Sphingomonas populi]|uniref:Class A beta-lactamase-related serine hydrolase n=1 Tax=Sphingomonas populi TaxID=2484750 RepID=A0A4Q6Y2I4_9SPHN|nr:serine hydrolase domain-containing protein [Sphingomonas populi]RZF63934.1 class A beta-lactamase-related serine hydrolase [Sphingomonas populi]
MKALLAALLLTAAPVSAQELSPAETAKVDRIVADSLARTGVPSASIAIVRGGRIVLAKAYGKQSETIPIARADTKYPIASISKQFTAAAMLLLRDQGKLSLDDTVSKYVPGISGGDIITIRQLLSHTSGLQDYWPQDYSFAAMREPVTPQDIIDRWAKKPLDFAPGTQWQYSNTGYVIAGMIVEKVAGMPLLDVLKGHVFTPLGMAPVDQDLANGPGYPQGYQRFALGPVRAERPAAHGWLFAAGELAMSASDLAKWDIARMNRTLLPAADWAEQETPVKLTDGTTNGYGLGVTAGEQQGHRFVEHSGEAVGFLSQNTVFPDDKAAVVVLVNSDFSDAFSSIAAQIAETILPPSQTQRAEVANTAKARGVYAMLRSGTLDRTLMTSNSNDYFTATALADYKATLAPLGEPKSFDLVRAPRLRGGFVNRNYRAVFADRTLNIVTYAEPGETGRYEQFLVMPSQ